VHALEEKGKIGVLNLQGRMFLYPIDCPFKTADWAIQKMQDDGVKVIIVDFHAEATAEKISMGWHLDGRVSAVIGTHTHIQTTDARILPNGTAYITDVGMTGPYDSVIGMKKEVALKRMIHQTPYRYELATDDVHFCGVFVAANLETGKAEKVERIVFPEF
jgi:metallophosphoesterase (TIGR00282 family)